LDALGVVCAIEILAGLEVAGLKSRAFGDPAEHGRPDLIAVMEGPGIGTGKAGMAKLLVRAATFRDNTPTTPQERFENFVRLGSGPLAHAAKEILSTADELRSI